MSVARNTARIKEQIDAAAVRAGRALGEVHLMAVTKTVTPDRIRQAYDAGIRLFGENRVQEFASKVDALRGLDGIRCHMIGHLQTNKAARAVELFEAVDSVDSVRLARKLDSAAVQLGKRFPVLLEINIGGESAKNGMAPGSFELEELLSVAGELSSLQVCGLMTVPPYTGAPEASRPYFRRMRELFRDVSARRIPGVYMETLSMGMSHDFEVAVEEGATCVRVGTAIFGERTVP